MPGKPHQSMLIPYEDEISELRRRRPPKSYARIAKILEEKYQVRVCRETIFKFVRVRSRGRKVFGYDPEKKLKKAIPNRPAAKATGSTANSSRKPEFEFVYSERYNLRRLPPDEAAAIRKELEKEGH